MTTAAIQKLTEKLFRLLVKALDSPTLTHAEICQIEQQGLYIIFEKKTIVYVGKTNRTGKVRMRELAADFRSHTFNRKLLANKFKDLGYAIDVLRRQTKKEWLDTGVMSKAEFKSRQKEINEHIKQSLTFKFYIEPDERALISLEHFAIAVLQPMYND